MKSKSTPEVIEFVLDNYLKMSRCKMAVHFGFSETVLNRIYKQYNLKVPKQLSIKFRIESVIGKTSFTPEEDSFITENYLTMPIKTMASKIGRSHVGIRGRLKNLNLVIPKEIIEQRKLESRYKKGREPENKGKKQSEYMTPEMIARTARHRFAKGHIPKNALEDWQESIVKDKRGIPYTKIKIPGERGLIYKHVWLWREANGKIPKGSVIIFKDKNTMNCVLENLERITKAENMIRNSIHNYPEDLKQVIKAKSILNKTLQKYETDKI